MSYKTTEDRPILKARRLTKFESKSAAVSHNNMSISTSETFKRQGFKRPSNEVIPDDPKKFCNDFQSFTGTTKNLANNRLQRLKQTLKSDIEQNCVSREVPGESGVNSSNVLKVSVSQASPSRFNKQISHTSLHTNAFTYSNTDSEYKHPNLHNQVIPHTTNTMENHSNKSRLKVSQSKSIMKHCESHIYQPAVDINSETKSEMVNPSRSFKVPNTEATLKYSESHSSQTPFNSSHSNSKNIYQNLDKWASPSDKYPAKNLANQRLNRLKKVVSDIKSTVDFPSPTNEFKPVQTTHVNDKSPSNNEKAIGINNNLHCSLVNSRLSGTKRSTDNCCNSDVECSPAKKSSPIMHKSPLLRNYPESFYIQSCTQNIDRQSGNNVSSPESSTKPSSNIFNRIMKIKKNMETINNSFHKPVSNSEIHDVSNTPRNDMKSSFERLKHNQETDISDSSQVCFKEPTVESQEMKYNVNVINDLKQKANETIFDSNINNSRYKTTKPDSNNGTPKSTNISQRINLNRNVPIYQNISYSQVDKTDTNLKSHLEPPEQKNPVSHCETENFDNYNGKLKMTAAWVWNHQNINSTPETPQRSDITISSEIAVQPIPEEIDEINDTDEMEWTNAEPDSEMIEAPQKLEQDIVKKIESKDPVEVEKSKELCIVVDTNVFISGLSKVKDIMNLKLSEPILPIIYVPWMVITELDYMKHNCSDDRLKQKVTSAVKFINTTLENENPRFLGQTINDMEKQKTIGISPDDKIVSCCIQATEKYSTVILLSNDLNLRSKALINNIPASSANEIIMKILSKTTKTVKSQKVMQKMGMLCSSVICECAKDTFGDAWSKMDLLSNPPWSLRECLKRFRKYWPTVFQDKVMKQFTMIVDQLLTIFQNNRYFADDSNDYVKFMKLCINLCIFMKDINQCRGSVENILRDITKI